MTPVSPTPTEQPTRVRYGVVGLCMALAVVTYLDRACIGTLAPHIMRDLSLSKEQMSVIYSAFALAYAAFEIPTAWWADRRGTRLVLTRIVLWWSGFTMLTATAWSFTSMLVVRFLFGAGEAGAWPSAARTFSRWIPQSERGTIQGIFFAGAHLAGGATPFIVLALLHVMSWRTVFVTFGTIGIVWCIAWYRWFRDEPSEHPRVNAAERARIEAGRAVAADHPTGWAYWRRLLGHRNTIPLCLMYLPNSFAFYFCITWLPTYLREKHGFDSVSLGFFSGLPLLLSVGGDLFGGVATDAVTRRFGLRVGRAGVGALAYILAGGAMILGGVITQPVAAAWLIAIAVGASMFILAAAWSTCMDIGGAHAGVVSAAMNTAGQVGSILSPLMVTALLSRTGNWNAPLFVMGGLFLMGALAWALIDPRERIFD
jgi:MFS transporter, ACS family, glucarate transporter